MATHDTEVHVDADASPEPGRHGWPVWLAAVLAVLTVGGAMLVTIEEPEAVSGLGDLGGAETNVVETREDDQVRAPEREPASELAPNVVAERVPNALIGDDPAPMLLPSLALPTMNLPTMSAGDPAGGGVSGADGSAGVSEPGAETPQSTTTAPTTVAPADGAAEETTETATPTTTTTTSTTSTTTTTSTPEAAPVLPTPEPANRPAVVAAGAMPQPIGVPGGQVQFGFNVDLWGADRANYWNALEAVPGNGRLIAHEFKSFTKEINTDLYQWHLSEGRDLLLTWNGTDAQSILNGTHDEWIRQHARQLGTLSDTIMLRFWHEPDVSYKADWIDGDPQNFIDSWMYVRQIFLEEGTTNIEWVWCPTAWNWDQQGALFYPGDANVDWICADGYSGFNLDRPLEPITDEFVAFQAWADQRPNKPIIIAEFGATARGPGDRAEWVRGIPGWVSASPNIRAVVYFDYDKRGEQPWDWRIRTEPDAWNALLDVLSSAPFGS